MGEMDQGAIFDTFLWFFLFTGVFFSLSSYARFFLLGTFFFLSSLSLVLSFSRSLVLFLMKCVTEASHETRKERIASIVFSLFCLVYVLHACVRDGVHGLVCATRLDDRE
jgi:hypothetical protein